MKRIPITGRPIDIADVVAGLAARAPALAAELLPGGVRDGHHWRVGSIHGDEGRSLCVWLSGPKAGEWCDFATGEGGDALSLVAAVDFNGDMKQAFRWALDYLGHEVADPAARRRRRAEGEARAVAAERQRNRRRENAFAIWTASRERIKGTPVQAYLQGRGIDFTRLSRQPRCLRYHPALTNVESGRQWPALIAAVSGPDGRICAVHRTWLGPRDGGGFTKAPLDKPKMVLGGFKGGAIRIWRGSGAKPLKEAPEGSMVAIAEGIEDALTVALARPAWRVLAAVSLSNMRNVALPETIGTVILVADNDRANSAADRALAKAAVEFQGQGRVVKIARPPEGYKDFNELLCKDGAV